MSVADPTLDERIDSVDVLDTERVCHVAEGCFGTALLQVPFTPLKAVCGAEVAEWCKGAKCSECDTCREVCVRCGLLICPECREAMGS
jgi:hypothetical protein